MCLALPGELISPLKTANPLASLSIPSIQADARYGALGLVGFGWRQRQVRPGLLPEDPPWAISCGARGLRPQRGGKPDGATASIDATKAVPAFAYRFNEGDGDLPDHPGTADGRMGPTPGPQGGRPNLWGQALPQVIELQSEGAPPGIAAWCPAGRGRGLTFNRSQGVLL